MVETIMSSQSAITYMVKFILGLRVTCTCILKVRLFIFFILLFVSLEERERKKYIFVKLNPPFLNTASDHLTIKRTSTEHCL